MKRQFKIKTLLIALTMVAVCLQCNMHRRVDKSTVSQYSSGDQLRFDVTTYGWPMGIFERSRKSAAELVGETETGHKIYNWVYYSNRLRPDAIFQNCLVATMTVSCGVWLTSLLFNKLKKPLPVARQA